MTTEPTTGTSAEPPKSYTAVVYVHGMGQQRRFEEMSRLIDSLDKHANALSRKAPAMHYPGSFDPRWLARVMPRLEPCRASGTTDRDDVGYVRLDCAPPDCRHDVGSLYRFYEVYWAPVAAGGTTVRSVVQWLAAQVLTPLRTMRSAWRERQRLRRGALHGLWRKPWLTAFCTPLPGDLEKLTDAYDEFEGPRARRDFSAGTFSQFIGFLHARKHGPVATARLTRLTRCWGVYYLLTEIAHLAVLLTLVLSVASLAALAVYSAWWLYDFVWNREAMAFWRQGGLTERLAPSLPNAMAALGLFMSAIGVTRFVTSYLGDVQFWCTYEETDEKHVKRAAILALATQQLEHVLADERCARVVVVAHSLGTAIAMDALLQLARHNRARNNQDPIAGPIELTKIVAFVTMGSPIDKIHYFFESYRSTYHRYIRVAEGVRGDITTAPFARNGKPYIHWINFCDRGDVISGPLETPSGARLANLQVDNVQVSNYWFPDPSASHSGYFDHDGVIGHLYDIIFKGTADFALAPRPHDRAERQYEAVLLGPGRARPLVAVFQLLALLAPWLLGIGALLGAAGWAWRWSAALTATTLAIGWIVGRSKGILSPIG